LLWKRGEQERQERHLSITVYTCSCMYSRLYVQLCYEYDIDVALCSSGAILLPFVVILVTLSFHNSSLVSLFLVTVCFLPSLANKRHHMAKYECLQ